MSVQLRAAITQNLLWFGISLVLAFFVWFFAIVQSDPIQAQTYRSITVQIVPDDGFIVANQPTNSVLVTLRAQQTVLAAITRDDITVSAALVGKTAGTHTVPLNVRVNRPGIIAVDTQPTQITVTLERVEVGQKPVRIVITNPPPADYAYDEPTPDIFQVEVRGSSSQVASVVYVQGEIDLGNERNPLETDIQLFAVDADGNRINDILLTPLTTRAQVNIYSRPDVKQVTVRPNIRFETLPTGYVFQSIRAEPQFVYLSGTPSELAAVGDTVTTAPIDLTGQTGDFEISVPLDLPSNQLLVLSGDNAINVNIGIAALVTARQIDNVPVEVIGLPRGATITLTPPTVSIVLNGAITVVEDLTSKDVQAIIDMNGLASGNYERVPNVIIKQGQVIVDNYQLLPPRITVNLVVPTPQPENTPEATPETP
jgi:YbbR domain-containing protein